MATGDGVLINRLSFPGEENPSEPAEVDQPDAQEQKREPQPQTATLPGGSGAAQPLSEGFVRAPDHAPTKSPELDASEDREGQADRCRG